MTLLADEAIYSLAVKGVQGIKPYEPGKPLAELEREYGVTDAVKLASNENPLGMSSKAQLAIVEAARDASLYPDGNAFYLKRALAAHLSHADKANISSAQINIGNGSNELLEIIARCFVNQNAAIMYSQHAFAVYPLVTQAIGAAHQMIPASDWGHDLAAMREAVTDKTTLIFIANPNNPTGTYLDPVDLLSFINSIPKRIIVVVDEAYHEYISRENHVSAMAWLSDYDNLIVTRTFSKAYGLAGLRIGYCVSHVAVANLLNRVRQPFNVNVIALAAAEAALGDQAFISDSVSINNAGKKQLVQAFDDLGLAHISSQGNFIALDLKRDAADINELLLKNGIIVRPIGAYQMPTYLRVSVGTEAQNTRFIDALQAVLSECSGK